MGSGSSKENKKKMEQQVPKLSPIIEPRSSIRSRPPSPQVPPVSSRQESPQVPPISSRRQSSQAPPVSSRRQSVDSRTSSKKSPVHQPNGVGHRTPFRDIGSNTPRGSVDIPLPPIDNSIKKSTSRSSTRMSTAIQPAPINHSRLGSNASCASHRSLHRKHSDISHKEFGRCSRCPHCQRANNNNNDSPMSTPKPKWLSQSPRIDRVHIDMDEYDIEAVRKKVISKNGHVPGSYDYQPYLTIEQTDYDLTKENYYTQPFVARMKPRVLPANTPFPDFELLERREHRLNKPYTLPLFDD